MAIKTTDGGAAEAVRRAAEEAARRAAEEARRRAQQAAAEQAARELANLGRLASSLKNVADRFDLSRTTMGGAPTTLLSEQVHDRQENCLDASTEMAFQLEQEGNEAGVLLLTDPSNTDGNNAGHALTVNEDGQVWDPSSSEWYGSYEEWHADNPQYEPAIVGADGEPAILDGSSAYRFLTLPPEQRTPERLQELLPQGATVNGGVERLANMSFADAGGGTRPPNLESVNALAARLGIPAHVAQSIIYNPDLSLGQAFEALTRLSGNESVSVGQLGTDVTPEQIREWQAQGYTVALWNPSGTNASGQPMASTGDNVVMGADVENLLTSGVYGGGQGWEVVLIAPAGSGLTLPSGTEAVSAGTEGSGALSPETREALEAAGWPPEAIAAYDATSQAVAGLGPQGLQDVQGMVAFAQQNPEATYVGIGADGTPVAMDSPPTDGTAYIYQPPTNPTLPPQSQAQPVFVSNGAQVPLSFMAGALADRAAATVSELPPEEFNTVVDLVTGSPQDPGSVALPQGWELQLEPGQTTLTAGATLLIDGQPYALGDLRSAVGMATLEQVAYLPPEQVASLSDLTAHTGVEPSPDTPYLHPDGNWSATPPTEGPYLQRLPNGEEVVMINGLTFPPEAVNGALALRAAEVAPTVASEATPTEDRDVAVDYLSTVLFGPMNTAACDAALAEQATAQLTDLTLFATTGVPYVLNIDDPEGNNNLEGYRGSGLEGNTVYSSGTAQYANQLYLPAAEQLLEMYPGATVEILSVDPSAVERSGHTYGAESNQTVLALTYTPEGATEPVTEYYAITGEMAGHINNGDAAEVSNGINDILMGDRPITDGLSYTTEFVPDGVSIPFMGEGGILEPVQVDPQAVLLRTDAAPMVASWRTAVSDETHPLDPQDPLAGRPTQAFTFTTADGQPFQVQVPPTFDIASIFQSQAARGTQPALFVDPSLYSAQGYQNRARFELAQQLGIAPSPANMPPELVTLMETDPAAAAAWLDNPANWDSMNLYPSDTQQGAYLDQIMRHVEAENGDGPLNVTMLPVVVQEPGQMPQPLPVMRFERADGSTYFVDHTGKFYEDWEDWEIGSVYPPDATVFYPPDGEITTDGTGRAEFASMTSPATVDTWQEHADRFLDTASVVVGFGVAVIGLMGAAPTGGASLGLTALGVGAMAWQTKESVENIQEMEAQHVDQGSAAYLWEYANVGFNLLGLGSMGVGALADLAGAGTGLARAAGVMKVLTNAADVAQLGGGTYMLASQWENMDAGQRLMGLFGVAMSAAAVHSNFSDGLAYTDAFGAPSYTRGVRFAGAVDAMFNPTAQNILANVNLGDAYPGDGNVPDFATVVADPNATIVTADGTTVNAQDYIAQLNESGTESYFVMGRNAQGDLRLFEMTTPDAANQGQVTLRQQAFTSMVEQGYLPLSGGHNHPEGSTLASQADLEAAPVVSSWAQGIYDYYGIQGHSFDNSIITSGENGLSTTTIASPDGTFSIRTRPTEATFEQPVSPELEALVVNKHDADAYEAIDALTGQNPIERGLQASMLSRTLDSNPELRRQFLMAFIQAERAGLAGQPLTAAMVEQYNVMAGGGGFTPRSQVRLQRAIDTLYADIARDGGLTLDSVAKFYRAFDDEFFADGNGRAQNLALTHILNQFGYGSPAFDHSDRKLLREMIYPVSGSAARLEATMQFFEIIFAREGRTLPPRRTTEGG